MTLKSKRTEPGISGVRCAVREIRDIWRSVSVSMVWINICVPHAMVGPYVRSTEAKNRAAYHVVAYQCAISMVFRKHTASHVAEVLCASTASPELAVESAVQSSSVSTVHLNIIVCHVVAAACATTDPSEPYAWNVGDRGPVSTSGEGTYVQSAILMDT